MSDKPLGPQAVKVLENIRKVSEEVCGHKPETVVLTPEGVALAVGQKWYSTDPRESSRPPITIKAIDGVKGYITTDSNRKIRIKRMRNNRKGYALKKKEGLL